MYSLRALLAWANVQYRAETPEMQHAVAHTDEGGAPEMKPAAASYLGLLARKVLTGNDTLPDDWRALAGRKSEGVYLTPLRYAIALCPDAAERQFLRDLVPELYFPSEVAEIHGIPRWAAGYVMHGALSRLRDRFDHLMRQQEKGTAANIPWTALSESQQRAEDAA